MKTALTFLGWPILFLPILVFNLGLALNAACTIANGGVMPVRSVHCAEVFGDSDDPMHDCETPASRLKSLDDRITQGDGLFSLGDQFIDAREELTLPCRTLWLAMLLTCAFRRRKPWLD